MSHQTLQDMTERLLRKHLHTIFIFLTVLAGLMVFRIGHEPPANQITLLSFDVEPVDGKENVLSVLDILQESDVEATFFITGEYAEQHPDVVKQIAKEGHEIACHSYSHPKMPDLSSEQKKEELVQCKQILEDLTGNEVLGFRAPYTLLDKETANLLQETGYRYDASVISGWEWAYPDIQEASIKEMPVSSILLIPIEDVIWTHYTKGIGTKLYFYIMRERNAKYSSYLYHPHHITEDQETKDAFKEMIAHLKKRSTIFISHSRLTDNHGG